MRQLQDKNILIRVSRELHSAVKSAAELENTTMSEFVRDALEKRVRATRRRMVNNA